MRDGEETELVNGSIRSLASDGWMRVRWLRRPQRGLPYRNRGIVGAIKVKDPGKSSTYIQFFIFNIFKFYILLCFCGQFL